MNVYHRHALMVATARIILITIFVIAKLDIMVQYVKKILTNACRILAYMAELVKMKLMVIFAYVIIPDLMESTAN